MTKSPLTTLALAGVLALGGTAVARAQDSSALLDALVRKKVLTSQEAEDVRADLIRENATTNAGKLHLSNSVTSLKLYGDVRLRYQNDNRDPQIDTAPTLADLETETVLDSAGKATTVYVLGQTKIVDPVTGKVVKGQVKQGKTGLGKPQNGVQRSMERIRLRLNADFELSGGVFGGIMLQTSQAADSGNQTMGDSSNGAAGFGNYNIYISRAFVGWNATDWFTAIGGKQANPFYTTDLVWAADINPDGFVEKIDLLKLFNRGSEEAVSYSADGKKVASVSKVKIKNPFQLSLVAGQFVQCDNAEDAVGGDYKSDAWLFQTQLIGSAQVSKNVKVTLAPGFIAYTAGNVTNPNNSVPFAGGVSEYRYSAYSKRLPLHTQGATRDLAIITAPGDVSFKVCGLKTKVLWDFAYNTEGAKRVEDIYGLQGIEIPHDTPVLNSKKQLTYDYKGNVIVTRTYTNSQGVTTDKTLVSSTKVSGHKTQDDIAWLLGFQVGENKKAGDWSVMANFRQTGIGSIDPNLNDATFALSYLNMQGIKTGVAYNFTDFCIGAVTYYDAWNLRKDLVGGEATGGQKIANMNAVRVLQVELNVKF